jgi:hypothetical protein
MPVSTRDWLSVQMMAVFECDFPPGWLPFCPLDAPFLMLRADFSLCPYRKPKTADRDPESANIRSR